jgi:hypothetical protein
VRREGTPCDEAEATRLDREREEAMIAKERCCEVPKSKRLVCHNCYTKGPREAVGVICNCLRPKLHVHCITHACDLCELTEDEIASDRRYQSYPHL